MTEYTVGTMAYIDSMRLGFINCKVVEVIPLHNMLKVQITKSTPYGAYKKGEIVEILAGHIVPRKQVHTRNGQYRINTQYKWV